MPIVPMKSSVSTMPLTVLDCSQRKTVFAIFDNREVVSGRVSHPPAAPLRYTHIYIYVYIYIYILFLGGLRRDATCSKLFLPATCVYVISSRHFPFTGDTANEARIIAPGV